MSTRKLNAWARWAAVGVVALAGLRPAAGAQPAPSPSDAAMALRLAALSRMTAAGMVRMPVLDLADNPADDPAYRQAAALLDGARRCDPTEPRYARRLADVMLRLRRTASTPALFEAYTAGAIDALNGFRQLRPDDRLSQVQMIDLYASRMETVDQRLKYFIDLTGRSNVPAEIRAIFAYQAARLLLEQGRPDEAASTIDEVLKLDPLNLLALEMKYERTRNTATAQQRVTLILTMLQADPAQPRVLVQLAQELARAGLPKESLSWYGYAINTAGLSREYLPQDLALEYAGELVVAGQINEAQAALDRILTISSEYYQAMALRMVVEQHRGQKEAADKDRVQARNVLLNNLANARKELGVQGATTRPITEEQPIPDLAGDVERFKASTNPAARQAYLAVVRELTWFEAYFDRNGPEAERLLKHYTTLASLPAPGTAGQDEAHKRVIEVFAARVSGWVYLLAGKTEEAKVKLSAVAADDPMAALGLLRTYTDKAQAKAAAEKLLAANPAGLLGALLLEGIQKALPEANVQVKPSDEAPAVRASLGTFPDQWMRVIDRPDVFYTLRADPWKVTHAYGEPMYVRVTIQNINNFPVTIAHELGVDPESGAQKGVLRPLVLFGAQIGGGFRQAFLPDVCFDQITDLLILRPKQTITRILRFDEYELARLLTDDPVTPITIMGQIRTNPVFGKNELFSDPGGYAAPFARYIERQAYPVRPEAIDESLKPALTALDGADVREKMRNVELLAVLSSILQKDQRNADLRQKGEALVTRWSRFRTDPDANLRAWTSLLYVKYGMQFGRPVVVRTMLRDPAWQVQLLGVAALPLLEPQDQKALATEVTQSDAQQSIKDFAAATLQLLQQQPTTRPATLPAATRPAAVGG